MTVERDPSWYCGAFNPKRQKTCRNRAGARTDHVGAGPCWVHLGTTPTVVAHAHEELRQRRMEAAARQFAVPIDTDPEQGLLDMVAESAGLVAFYRARVEELIREQDREALGDDKAAAAVAWQKRFGVDTGAGMFGPKIEIDRMGDEHVVGEDLRGFAKLYNAERDRLVKYAKSSLDAGVAKRQVEQATRFGDQMVMVLMNVFSRLGLDAGVQAEARQLVAQEFRLLAQQERAPVVVAGSAKEVP